MYDLAARDGCGRHATRRQRCACRCRRQNAQHVAVIGHVQSLLCRPEDYADQRQKTCTDASVLLASEDSQIGVRMRVCLYGQDRTHRSSSRRSGAACETVRDRNTPQKIVWRVQDVAFGGGGSGGGGGGGEGGKSGVTGRPWG